MEYGLILIFWYGILHAFGPDHLSAIADFSIGKEAKKTFAIVSAFAIGHGVMLFLFAKILETCQINEEILSYGDIIASSVIILIGLYLLTMVVTNRIHLRKHIHEDKEHLHIWFGKEHEHQSNVSGASALSMGILMGIGGVRGMLVTLGVLQGRTIDADMIVAFIAGVMVVFFSFGWIVFWINKEILTDITNIRRIFSVLGVISVGVGTHMLIG